VDGIPPTAPAGLVATAEADGVHLPGTSTRARPCGYLVYRDGKALTSTNLSSFGRAWASSEYIDRWFYHDTVYAAGLAVDGKVGYPSIPWMNDSLASGQIMWGLDFDEPLKLGDVNLTFDTRWYPAPRIYVEGRVDGVWTLLATATENLNYVRTISFEPVYVTGIRLRFPFEQWEYAHVLLSEVEVVPAGTTGPVMATSFLDTNLADPLATEHRWQVARSMPRGTRVRSVRRCCSTSGRRILRSPLRLRTPWSVPGSRSRHRQRWSPFFVTLAATLDGEASTEVAHGAAAIDGGALGTWEPPSVGKGMACSSSPLSMPRGGRRRWSARSTSTPSRRGVLRSPMSPSGSTASMFAGILHRIPTSSVTSFSATANLSRPATWRRSGRSSRRAWTTRRG